ncbi:MAG: SGNH/GDSL hydrolase family protein [Litoreibacter sp.]
MKTTLLAATALTVLAVPASARSVTDIYTSYYAFGDSLTDDGKLGALEAPSLEGRFSNGRVYAEFIADEFANAGLDTGNLALGGATAGDTNLLSTEALATFGGQVDVFQGSFLSGAPLPIQVLPTLTFGLEPPVPGENPLVSVLFGANDIFQGGNPFEAADAVADNIRDLASTPGGAFDDFLVLNLPSFANIPAFAGNEANGFAVTAAFNGQLAANILELEDEGLNIISFDTDGVFQRLLDDIDLGGTEFGILDGTTPCTVSISANLDPLFSNPFNCVEQGIDPNTLLFVDSVHPNAVAQALVGSELLSILDAEVAPVPLPAAAPLYLLALTGMGVVARRRRSR